MISGNTIYVVECDAIVARGRMCSSSFRGGKDESVDDLVKRATAAGWVDDASLCPDHHDRIEKP